MTAEDNIAATRRFITEGFTDGRLEVCDELVAEDMVEHQRGLRQGREGAKDTSAPCTPGSPTLSCGLTISSPQTTPCGSGARAAA